MYSFLSDTTKKIKTEIEIQENGYAARKKIVDLAFPQTAVIAMIKIDDIYIIPNGSTEIKPKDILIILSDNR